MFMSSKAGNKAVLHFQTVQKVELTLLFKRCSKEFLTTNTENK